jgi:hypothetical protein
VLRVLLLVVVLLKSSARCTSDRAISSSVRGASEMVLAVVDGMVVKRYGRLYLKRGPIQTTLCRTYRVGKPGDRELRVRVGDPYDYHQSIGALVYLTYTD